MHHFTLCTHYFTLCAHHFTLWTRNFMVCMGRFTPNSGQFCVLFCVAHLTLGLLKGPHFTIWHLTFRQAGFNHRLYEYFHFTVCAFVSPSALSFQQLRFRFSVCAFVFHIGAFKMIIMINTLMPVHIVLHFKESYWYSLTAHFVL
jgi:hypothetical protein